MEDHEVLQHLLELENKAATIVNDAQSEADRRISVAEKQNRKSHDEVYAQEVEALETHFTQNLAAVKEDYRQQLEIYHESLKTQPQNKSAFSLLVEKFLLITLVLSLAL